MFKPTTKCPMDANCLSNFVQDKKKKTGSLTSWFSSLHLFLTQKMMEEEVEEEEVSKVIWPPRQHYCCQLNLENSVKLFQSVLIGILITWFSTNKQQEYRTKGFSAENNPGLLSTGFTSLSSVIGQQHCTTNSKVRCERKYIEEPSTS